MVRFLMRLPCSSMELQSETHRAPSGVSELQSLLTLLLQRYLAGARR